ncbi:MAG: aminotransferase class V-fold PLP-dependent enzyme [Planctomycetes bacterium]|nr:aminotransferase class V-fold PLP-dependent enzyme [Planctomycetota bacterium]
MAAPLPAPSPLAAHWDLDPDVVFLNHGSFGACPRVVLAEQQRLRRELEAEPVRFLHRELEARLDAARAALAAFVGAEADDLAFVPNATTGVNTVLRSLAFAPGDELLVTDHEYNACRNVLDFVAAGSGARVVVVPLPFPIEGPHVVVERVLAAVTARTRLLLVDHVTSPTGLVLPVAELVAALHARGIDTLVDGAHAPGMLPLDLCTLGAAYYTGNCHKWLCTPKGSALLHVRADRQQRIRPLVLSHGANSRRTDRSRFRLEFDFPGTHDPTPYLCVPAALQFLAGLLPGGIAAVQRHNHELAVAGRDLLCRTLGIAPPAPTSMLGSLAAVPLPQGGDELVGPLGLDPLQHALFERHRIEVPVMRWATPKLRLLRISPQVYQSREQHDHLARALAVELAGAARTPG